MDSSHLIGFAAVAALLVVSPGPNGVLIAKTVPASGRAAGFANVAGFVAAFFLHGSLSVFGISLILVQSADAFFVVKMLGAAYLCWLGVKALWEAWKTAGPIAASRPARGRWGRRGLLAAGAEGFLTNALNPKVSMFYLAAFPQFISIGSGTGTGAVADAFALVVVHAAINAVWFSAMIVLFDRLSSAARSGRFRKWLKTVTGVVFIGFGVRLAALRP